MFIIYLVLTSIFVPSVVIEPETMQIVSDKAITVVELPYTFSAVSQYNGYTLVGDVFLLINDQINKIHGLGDLKLSLTQGVHHVSILALTMIDEGILYSSDTVIVEVGSTFRELEYSTYTNNIVIYDNFDTSVYEIQLLDNYEQGIIQHEPFSFTSNMVQDTTINESINSMINVNSFGSQSPQIDEEFDTVPGMVLLRDSAGIFFHNNETDQVSLLENRALQVLVIHKAGYLLSEWGYGADWQQMNDTTVDGSFDFEVELFEVMDNSEVNDNNFTANSTSEVSVSSRIIDTVDYPFASFLVIPIIAWRRER
ncbi:MAG: hypothetical protein INQ03_09110 [Candidatus Heimdallarchaeota archaeon]|nr:hypothetical protein [Candidatus Heimdallarchaeota archaeon]